MVYDLTGKLVVAIASSALFDLKESDKVFTTEGESTYRKYQRENETEILQQGVVYPLVKRLLDLNDGESQPIEVVLFSRNDPDTGLRVFNSIEHYGLDITRAVFVTGKNPFKYLEAFNASLFLSANKDDVREAIEHGFPAGYVSETDYEDNEADSELRMAFDFDAVLADDASEKVFQTKGLEAYREHESKHGSTPMGTGPLYNFLTKICKIQKAELEKERQKLDYHSKIRIAVCTARNAPAHKRVVTTLREWDIRVDEAFFLGGMNKSNVLEIYQPHIFFDDQTTHIKSISKQFPSVHVPYGVANE
ncbi:5'-nucleotidase [Pseudogracilibacillus auburnensis]|uniref:5'-nucleotidase n=1 Tax=Pseudogracilibacillus auburnensis TaxID=1494959 RepID=A0A2V3W5L4_9BACI|nr:5'-nucleotidase [Pseudogracilibacillus auburnensis]PXW89402.1 5'-nucleotidase [Pseudogracilibacillus auburnensis]